LWGSRKAGVTVKFLGRGKRVSLSFSVIHAFSIIDHLLGGQAVGIAVKDTTVCLPRAGT
jgi:hypothetical protein